MQESAQLGEPGLSAAAQPLNVEILAWTPSFLIFGEWPVSRLGRKAEELRPDHFYRDPFYRVTLFMVLASRDPCFPLIAICGTVSKGRPTGSLSDKRHAQWQWCRQRLISTTPFREVKRFIRTLNH